MSLPRQQSARWTVWRGGVSSRSPGKKSEPVCTAPGPSSKFWRVPPLPGTREARPRRGGSAALVFNTVREANSGHNRLMGRKHSAAKPLKGFGGGVALEIDADPDGTTYCALNTVKICL